MKAIISAEELKRAVALPFTAVPSVSPIPIATHLLVSAGKDKLTVLGSNFEMWVEDVAPAEVSQQGALCVPAKLFQSFAANSIPGSQVSLTIEKNSLVMRCGKMSARLPMLPAEDFTQAPTVEDGAGLILAGEALRTALKRTSFAASDEQARYYLCGVYVCRVNDNIEFCATDGAMLARVRVPCPDHKLKVSGAILPKVASAAILKMSDQGGEATLEIGSRIARVSINSTSITTRLVDGTFPEYERVIPKEFSKDAVIERDALLAALDHVTPFDDENKSRVVQFSLTKGSLVLSAGTANQIATDEVECVYAGTPIKFAIAHRLLKPILLNMPKGEVGLRFNDAGSPFVFSPSDDSEDVWVAMPYAVKAIAEVA